MDCYGNREDVADLYPRPASAGCANYSNWSPSNPSSSLFGSTSGERLEHLVKSRPRKPKSRAPTRVSIISSSLSPSSSTAAFNADTKTSSNNSRVRTTSAGFIAISDKIDDGLESFFSKPGVEEPKKNSKTSNKVPIKQTTATTISSSIRPLKPPKTIQTTSPSPASTTTTIPSANTKIHTANSLIPRQIKPTPSPPNIVSKLSEKSTTSSTSSATNTTTTTTSKSPTKAIQKIIKSFEIRVNRESVK